MIRVLLAGESWISHSTHYKGFDEFSSTTFHTGADAFLEAARSQDIEIEQMYAHDVPSVSPARSRSCRRTTSSSFPTSVPTASCFPLRHGSRAGLRTIRLSVLSNGSSQVAD